MAAVPRNWSKNPRALNHFDFFAAAALAFAALFRLLLIITMPKKEPTTADPRSVKITGIRIAHTLGGNSDCNG